MAMAVNRWAALALDSLLILELTQKPPVAHTFHQGFFPAFREKWFFPLKDCNMDSKDKK